MQIGSAHYLNKDKDQYSGSITPTCVCTSICNVQAEMLLMKIEMRMEREICSMYAFHFVCFTDSHILALPQFSPTSNLQHHIVHFAVSFIFFPVLPSERSMHICLLLLLLHYWLFNTHSVHMMMRDFGFRFTVILTTR